MNVHAHTREDMRFEIYIKKSIYKTAITEIKIKRESAHCETTNKQNFTLIFILF